MAMLSVSALLAQSGSDVKTCPRSALNEGQVSMDIAVNGWIYQAFSIASGFMLVRSKDNGDTWTTLDSVVLAGHQYSVRIVVAGKDTNYLRVYMAVDEVLSGNSTLSVNIFDAANGNYITKHILDTNTSSSTRGFDIATDYKYPSAASGPYSIGVLYAKGGGYDSLLLIVSTDSGATFASRQKVATTGRFYRKVSLAYGISGTWTFGRFFMAWEQYTSPTDTVGNLYTSYTPGLLTDVPTAPLNLDSLYPTTVYQLRNPRIVTSQTASTDNDSGNITALVAVERIATGNSFANILGFENFSAVGGNTWKGIDIANTTDNTIEPDMVFEPVYAAFYLTYYNATAGQVPCIQNTININDFGGWNYVTTNYVDDVTKLVTPWPTVRINPAIGWPAWGWNNTYGVIQQAMFDAEYRLPAPVIVSLAPDTVLAGSGAFTLIVNGANFYNYSSVIWNTDTLIITNWTGTQLTATVPASLITTSGLGPITVVTPSYGRGGGGSSNSVTFYVISATEVTDLGGLNSVMVYPNPASGQLNIAYSLKQAGVMEMNLYDLNGRLVKQLNKLNYVTGNGNITDDVSNLSTGLYQLVISTDKGSTTRKISIIR